MANWSSTTITSTGQVQTASRPVRALEFHANSANVESVRVGGSDVSAINGREVPPGESFTPDFEPGVTDIDTFYVHLSGSGDSIDVFAIFK